MPMAWRSRRFRDSIRNYTANCTAETRRSRSLSAVSKLSKTSSTNRANPDPMKTQSIHLLLKSAILVLLSSFQLSTFAQGTAFTYQGRLNENGALANGSYDLQFSLYDAASNGNAIGAGVTNAATAVSNGLFVAALDFGPAVLDGRDRWLEIGVRTNGSSDPFAPLTP